MTPAEELRAAAQRLRIRALTVNPDAYPNPDEIRKWATEWEALGAWLHAEADVIDGGGRHMEAEALAARIHGEVTS